MGQAKRRKLAGDYPEQTKGRIETGKCSGCTLCCVLLPIEEMSKPAYVPCHNICAIGCSIHESTALPAVCAGFKCMHIEQNMPPDLLPPHPLKCGAYVYGFMQNGKYIVVVAVDPRRPFDWKKEAKIRAIMEATLNRGIALAVVDRGYQIAVRSPADIAHVLSADAVAEMRAKGEKPGFAGGDAFGT